MTCHRLSQCVLAGLSIAAFGSPAAAQSAPPPVLQAQRATAPPKLDGILDDPVWTSEPLPLGPWISYVPLRGEPAPETTQVWVAYDDDAIYFAFKCLDSKPESIRATVSRRDNVASDDGVVISLDSNATGQSAYHMWVNPLGIQMDSVSTGAGAPENFAADWVWQSAGRVDADGYAIEVRVPLQSIRFRSGANVQMRVLFVRRSSRLSVSWSSPEIPSGKWIFESQVPLVFAELRQPRVLEVIPSVTASRNQARGLTRAWDEPRSNGDLGVSLKYGLTSAITVDATVNPDFSQVESDAFEVEVNQRFPIFFTEKRPFFMEGVGLFNFAGTGGNSTMRQAVHTRRIIEPSAGIKLTGTSGRNSFALLATGDQSVPGDAQRVFTIGRGIRSLGDGQYAGVFLTSAELSSEHNRVVGADFSLRRGDHFQWNGSFLLADSRSPPGQAGGGVGSQLSYSYDTRRFQVAGQAEHYGRDFHMATAFINRVGITRVWQHQGVHFYPRYAWLKQITPFIFVSGGEDHLQRGTEHYLQPSISLSLTRQAFVFVSAAHGREPFANRQFRTGGVNIFAGAQLTKWLNAGGSLQHGPAVFYDPRAPLQGTRHARSLRATFQPNPKLAHNVSYNFVRFERESTGERVFDLHILNIRNVYQFTPEFFLRAIAQLDTSRRRVLTDFLASFELMPGTVVYAGYGSLLERGEIDLYRPTARAFFFKASYLARF